MQGVSASYDKLGIILEKSEYKNKPSNVDSDSLREDDSLLIMQQTDLQPRQTTEDSSLIKVPMLSF